MPVYKASKIWTRENIKNFFFSVKFKYIHHILFSISGAFSLIFIKYDNINFYFSIRRLLYPGYNILSNFNKIRKS